MVRRLAVGVVAFASVLVSSSARAELYELQASGEWTGVSGPSAIVDPFIQGAEGVGGDHDGIATFVFLSGGIDWNVDVTVDHDNGQVISGTLSTFGLIYDLVATNFTFSFTPWNLDLDVTTPDFAFSGGFQYNLAPLFPDHFAPFSVHGEEFDGRGSFRAGDLAATDDYSFGATLTDVGPSVPEPATWALMILGIGSVGAMLRRQKGKAGAVVWTSENAPTASVGSRGLSKAS